MDHLFAYKRGERIRKLIEEVANCSICHPTRLISTLLGGDFSKRKGI
jgi:hypothetical protein